MSEAEQAPRRRGEPEPEAVRLAVEELPGGLRAAVEAVLMVVDEPVTAPLLAAALEVGAAEVQGVLEQLAADYDQQQRGFVLRRYAGGWRVYSRAECAPAVERFLRGGAQARLSQAALETLAVVAYRQPISRARISAVRGVSVDGVVRTLLARGLIAEIPPENPSAAMLFGTTDSFLQRMGISDLEELPALAPYLPTDDVLDELAAEGLA
ncbi:MAG TPA: SMC-Scp complex subunit ScpB [Ornithinimicrobium sp.]|uniref:SMC-Scp complex subunit ScpB n=1 Tax=Ornithinimicrobium sp. TaxID=1977084 RepID=UPI002B47AD1D|nr:SMC-Scp complex subunit ScpB [Ornithinimicrobium sp.]HKJ11762.1 SMC-Scp complex subunit ScpB [Ornithinimicrobium sp.]